MDETKESALRDTPLDKFKAKQNEEAEGSNFDLTLATALHTEHDEDGPPIAEKFKVEAVSIVSVADGLGATGAGRHTAPDGSSITSAYIASRAAQEVVLDIANNQRETLAGDGNQIKELLESNLKDKFSSLAPKYPKERSGLRSNLLKDFPTTLATSVLQERAGEKKVILLWQGDSPLIVITPDKIYTTYSPGDGETPMGEDIVYANRQSLNIKELTFSKETPVLAVVASDFLIKLGDPELQTGLEFLFSCLKDAKSSADMTDRIKSEYEKRKAAGGIGLDDSTIAVTSSLSSLSDLDKFRPDAPIEYIS